jgi:hypothetical protein
MPPSAAGRDTAEHLALRPPERERVALVDVLRRVDHDRRVRHLARGGANDPARGEAVRLLVHVDDVGLQLAHERAQRAPGVPEEDRVRLPVHRQHVHRDVGVERRRDEAPAFVPRRRARDVHVPAVISAQDALALEELRHDAAVEEPENAHQRSRS